MPRISEVNGIVVAMYFADHWPPHFHVFYAGEEASLRIDTLDLLEGAVQNRALRLVRDWGELASRGIAEELGEGTPGLAPRQDRSAGVA